MIFLGERAVIKCNLHKSGLYLRDHSAAFLHFSGTEIFAYVFFWFWGEGFLENLTILVIKLIAVAQNGEFTKIKVQCYKYVRNHFKSWSI